MIMEYVHFGRAYYCICQVTSVPRKAIVVPQTIRDQQDGCFKGTCSLAGKTCNRCCADGTCVFYAHELVSEATDVNTLGNFPKKSKEV